VCYVFLYTFYYEIMILLHLINYELVSHFQMENSPQDRHRADLASEGVGYIFHDSHVVNYVHRPPENTFRVEEVISLSKDVFWYAVPIPKEERDVIRGSDEGPDIRDFERCPNWDGYPRYAQVPYTRPEESMQTLVYIKTVFPDGTWDYCVHPSVLDPNGTQINADFLPEEKRDGNGDWSCLEWLYQNYKSLEGGPDQGACR